MWRSAVGSHLRPLTQFRGSSLSNRMAALIYCFFLICGIEGMISSDLDSSTSLKQEVSQLEESIPLMIQAANEEILLYILDKMAYQAENLASNVSEMGKALREELEKSRTELQALLSHHSSRLEQLEDDFLQMKLTLENQSLLINKFNTYLEDLQNRCVGDPPSPRNGRPVDFERTHGSDVLYRCDRNFLPTANSTVRCNFGKWEGQPPVCTYTGLFDSSLTLRAHFEENGWMKPGWNVTCYSDENPQKLAFSRVLDTGSGGALPRGAMTSSQGRAAYLDLSSVHVANRRGFYQCGYEIGGKQTGVPFAIQPGGQFVWPQAGVAGDTVDIVYSNSIGGSSRWLHGGQRAPDGDNQRKLTIVSAEAEDAGVYERYDPYNRQDRQWFFRLVLRGCRANFFGERCDEECRPCYNGGICHDLLGTCICPPGFLGSSCEVACGRSRFGANCSESCHGIDCKHQIFCRPDPYGCSCAPGYKGKHCEFTCQEGKYGADCLQTCHCAGGTCDPYTGACSEGCSSRWTGQSCHIRVRD